MKLATRMTATVGTLVAASLALAGGAVLFDLSGAVRDAELQETRHLAESIAASLPRDPDGRPMLSGSAWRDGNGFALVPILPAGPLPHGWSDADHDRLDLVRRAATVDQALAERIVVHGTRIAACAVPLHDARAGVTAVLELERDQGPIEAVLRSIVTRVVVTLALIALLVPLVARVWARRSLERPLAKLGAGVTDVAHGDLAAVLLSEREDEIGALAARFNEMTASLREAREETKRGVLAQLALEARLRHSEKLATIGQLAAGIAHEVGTPLNVIGGRARAMARKAESPEEVAKNAQIVAEQAARITRIIQGLLDFARRRAPSRAEVDVTTETRSALDFLAHQIEGGGIEVRLTTGQLGGAQAVAAGERMVIPGDRDQVQQVVINLVLNAIQAMPKGGRLSVDVSRIVRQKPGLELAPAAPYVALTVQDTGVGIAPADRERVFEPFFSTKADGEGTGLGLSVSHGIVKDHDGWIDIESPAGGGTVFHVYLPASEAATVAAGSPPALSAAR